MHHVVNGGQYVNQMAKSVDYFAYLVNTALESKQALWMQEYQFKGPKETYKAKICNYSDF